ncbi:MAG: glycosyltransferase [Betaproteobacteria bacterium]|nr:glycosyltransferase [Betaproteobacteria bacterium]
MNAAPHNLPCVAAVIVTYNRLEKLRLTLEKTLVQPFSRVVVIDNASTDGTDAYLRGIDDPRLCIVHEPENLGGAGGFARGFEIAVRDTGVEWLLCFDDDAYPAADTLAEFADLVPGPEVGGVAAAVYFPDGRICPMNRPGMDIFKSPAVFLRAVLQRSRSVGLKDDVYNGQAPVEVCFSSFVGFFVRCDLVRHQLGLPTAELFVYRDDSLYTLALTHGGHKLLFAPNVRFVHDCSTPSSGRRVYDPLWKAYYIIRNDLPFFRAFAGGYFYFILPLLIMKFLWPIWLYDKPSLFWRVAMVALADGLRGNFSRSHDAVKALASGV